MKKFISMVFAFVLALGLFGCAEHPIEQIQTVEGNLKTYYALGDGTWQYDGQIYKYRLVIEGTMPNAKASSTFVYLSNLESISFDRAYKAAGISSHLNDYFSPEEAVLVEWTTQ